MTLCDNVLVTLAQRPGRIYEGRHEDITPLAPLTKVLADTTAATGKIVQAAVEKVVENIKTGSPAA